MLLRKCGKRTIEVVLMVTRLFCITSLLIVALGYAADSASQCFIDLPVYGPRGDTILSKIIAVKPLEGDVEAAMDLLTVQQKEYRASVSGEKLYFVKQFLGRSLLITFEDDRQRRFKQRVTLMSCEQRWSITRGQLDSGADVSGSIVSGRLSGCLYSGNWWIRAMPMFGAEQSPRAFDAYVKNDGSFQLTASLAGQRYILVVGKDKQPIKAIAADVVVGGKNDAGTIDLTGLCPK